MAGLDTSWFGDGQCWPPGFRFHPTDEELVLYFLKRKICRLRLMVDIIGVTDVYKWDPEELPGQSKIKTGDRQWYFFSPRDRKYPNGARSNRATRHGFWKTTGKDRVITCKSRAVGIKKTLVFYEGRAPTGQRTDWVMHEYTLDEEELKRCQSAQDYYALYKVYKKTGPGPKNGEQYGAPFREEDWADDHNGAVHDRAEQEDSLKKIDNICSIDNNRANGQRDLLSNDIEELMNSFVDQPVIEQPLAECYAYAQQEAVDGEETRITKSLREASLHDQRMVVHQSMQQKVQQSFDCTQLTTSQVRLCEASEVTSAPVAGFEEFHVAEEDFLEDFLEMNDLIASEPASEWIEKPVESLQNLPPDEEYDGLNVLDLCHDVAMFIQDMGTIDSGLVFNSLSIYAENEPVQQVLHPCLNNHHNEEENSVAHSYLNNLDDELVNPDPFSYMNNIDSEEVNLNDQPLPHLTDTTQIEGQLWVHNENFNVTAPAASTEVAVQPPISGVVIYGGNSASLPARANQNLSGEKVDSGESWFSSSIWTFVESIPTTPASAAESALMNKAFERMSSFSRFSSKTKTSSGNTNGAAGSPTATQRKSSSRYNRGLYCFSVLGVMFAIVWVLIGTSVTVLGGYVFS